MQLSDIISTFSKSLKCTKIVGGWGFALDPTGEVTALPRPIAWFNRVYLKPLLLRGEEGVEGRGDGAPLLGRLTLLCPYNFIPIGTTSINLDIIEYSFVTCGILFSCIIHEKTECFEESWSRQNHKFSDHLIAAMIVTAERQSKADILIFLFILYYYANNSLIILFLTFKLLSCVLMFL